MAGQRGSQAVGHEVGTSTSASTGTSALRRGAVAGVVAALALAACQPKSVDSGAASGEILVGATIPLSGALASFGSFQKWGYEHAVAEVNAAGGILIAGSPRRVRLVLRDDRTDANVAAANVDSLVSSEHVDALLGSCTPPLVVAAALAAERNATPLVTGCAPESTFTSVRSWQWAWDLFFSETQLAEATFQTLKAWQVVTNNKLAILHDNGADGAVVGGRLWPQVATRYGLQLVANVEFPTDTTDFGASVQQARDSGAQVLMVDAVTPQMVSIRKQLASAGYTPKVLVMEKGAEPTQFAEAVGDLADGVLVGGYWDASFSYPGAHELGAAFRKETGHTVSQHIADSYTAARVLLDAIAAAGSVDKAKVNAAIGATNQVYPVGPVKFAGNHFAELGIVELQWQGGSTRVVWPLAAKSGELLFPVPAH